MVNSEKLAVLLHSDAYDRMHQGLSVAVAAVSLGRPTHVFFFWWALKRLEQDRLDEPDFPAEHLDVASIFETRRYPTLRELLTLLKESRLCTFYACTASVGLVASSADPEKVLPEGMRKWMDRYVGWTSILQLLTDVRDRFYL